MYLLTLYSTAPLSPCKGHLINFPDYDDDDDDDAVKTCAINLMIRHNFRSVHDTDRQTHKQLMNSDIR